MTERGSSPPTGTIRSAALKVGNATDSASPQHCCRAAAKRWRRRQGFVLLEVLIAFVITMLAIGLVIDAASGALRAASNAARYQEAMLRAQSRLTAAADAGTPILGEREGDDGGGFHWHERVAVLRTDAGRAQAGGAAPITLYDIKVSVTWRVGTAMRSVALETQRVADAP